MEETYHTVDTTLKRIIRYDSTAFLRLARVSISDKTVRFEDTSVIQKEFRADQVCILTDNSGKDIGGVYLEYQFTPKPEDVVKWIAKWSSLNERLPYPVALLAVYLNIGKYASFHSEFSTQVGVLKTRTEFDVLLLWNHLDAIRSGAIPALIPLMTLCEEKPTVETFREEIELIHKTELPVKEKDDLFTFSFLIARKDLSREILLPILKEIYSMNRLPDIFEEAFEEVLKDRDAKNEAIGKAIGEAKGEVKEARAILMMLCERRLGEPSKSIGAQLEATDNLDALHALIRDFDKYESWEEISTSL